MAGEAILVDQQQNCVPVAIEPDLAQQLNVPGSFTLSP